MPVQGLTWMQITESIHAVTRATLHLPESNLILMRGIELILQRCKIINKSHIFIKHFF